MEICKYEMFQNKVCIRIKNEICESFDEMFSSTLFQEVLTHSIHNLEQKESLLLNIFENKPITPHDIHLLTDLFKMLARLPYYEAVKINPAFEYFFKDRLLLLEFIEYLYNYWRSFDRFVICDSSSDSFDKRPYRTFNQTIEKLTNLIRGTYRDIEENIQCKKTRVYRQVHAGAEIATISLPLDIPLPKGDLYQSLKKIPVIRQILLNPPLILNPPMNKRTGEFLCVPTNPLSNLDLNPDEWLAYPAMVGALYILIYFHKAFFDLGFSLCNLFELAEEEMLGNQPDALYLYGVPEVTKDYEFPTIYHEDKANKIWVATVPNKPEFGYFGYLKKMVLTLHNVIMIKNGYLPFHGSLTRLVLKDDKEATILLIGDTGTGKSETLEAFRHLGAKYIRDIIVIADDMGSISINEEGEVVGYGTETGAFLRLDDLQAGYAFGQLDRSIIMSPNKVNARIVLPVTTIEHVLKGYKIDYVLYANNYEEVDKTHPILERLDTLEKAFHTFKEGTAMSKGTTTSTGITHSYFSNPFGPDQFKDAHEVIAKKYFELFFKHKLYVGQLRTRLGISGYEKIGPQDAANSLLTTILS
ncbi:MAG: hypothetical protein A2Y40_02225 [Candidatus Margulisbacteria bacterium GWF2_35_9]|nr:MAG: hypothetical protein A2Y40_02225 [Candidatus Margulisbacteria bacterium GWF2_35_9]